MASLHNQKKDNNQFKNKNQPELSENQTTWKPDNPGVEETFIQPSRRGRDGKWAERMRSKVADCTGEAGAGGLDSPTFEHR